MPLPVVKVEDVYNSIIASIELQIGQTIPFLPKAFSRVIATALAGVITTLYKYNNYTFLQMFVATASNEASTVNGIRVIPLQAWGVLVGAGLPTPATAAEFDVDFIVTNQTGATIQSGTQFFSAQNGVTYLSTAPVLVNAATITIPMQAAGDQSGNGGVGSIGNLEVGAEVSFATAVTGVNQAGAVSTITTTASDAETTEQYRQRVTDRFQKRPQGGALVDYEIWSEETEGIINAYPYNATCAGQVDVYCEATESSSGSPDGFPTQAQLDDVLDNINLDENGRATRRPVNAWVNVYSITRKGFEVDVVGLEAPDLVTTQQQIEAGLTSLFRGYEPFIGGVSTIRRDRITAAEVGGVVAQIVSAQAGVFAGILLKTQPVIANTWEGRCVAADDDAEEDGGTVTVVAPVIELGGPDKLAGFRMPGVNVPAGSVVTSAYLTFVSATLNNTYSEFTVRGEANVNPAPYQAVANDISSRNPTVASTSWTPPGWPNASEQQSPDIRTSVQEILEITGWNAGQAMAFIVTGSDDSDREVLAFEAAPATAALLTINYDFPQTAFATTQVYTLGRGEKARLDGVNFT